MLYTLYRFDAQFIIFLAEMLKSRKPKSDLSLSWLFFLVPFLPSAHHMTGSRVGGGVVCSRYNGKPCRRGEGGVVYSPYNRKQYGSAAQQVDYDTDGSPSRVGLRRQLCLTHDHLQAYALVCLTQYQTCHIPVLEKKLTSINIVTNIVTNIITALSRTRSKSWYTGCFPHYRQLECF